MFLILALIVPINLYLCVNFNITINNNPRTSIGSIFSD
jgi:hypothetical protein